MAQNISLGIIDNHTDIGNVNIPGSAIFDSESKDYLMKGSGSNIWFDRDELHFLWRKINGDFILTCNVEFIGDGTDPHRKIGWMARNSLDTNAAHVSAVVHGDGLTSMQYMQTEGGITGEVRSSVSGPTVVRLERTGNIECSGLVAG